MIQSTIVPYLLVLLDACSELRERKSCRRQKRIISGKKSKWCRCPCCCRLTGHDGGSRQQHDGFRISEGPTFQRSLVVALV